MPSYRATVQILGMRDGHRPPEVLDVAVAALRDLATAEARSVEIERGVPVIVVRYAVEPLGDQEEDRAALAAAHAVREAVAAVATPGAVAIRRRVKGRWEPVGSATTS